MSEQEEKDQKFTLKKYFPEKVILEWINFGVFYNDLRGS